MTPQRRPAPENPPTPPRPSDAETLVPVWDVILGWVLILAAMLVLIIGWDRVVNGVEVVSFMLTIVGCTLLLARLRK